MKLSAVNLINLMAPCSKRHLIRKSRDSPLAGWPIVPAGQFTSGDFKAHSSRPSAVRRQLTSIRSGLPWLVSLAALTLRLVPELGASTLFSSSWGRRSQVPGAGWGAVQPTGAHSLEGAGEGHTVASHPSTSRSSSSSGGPRRGPRMSSRRSHLVWGHPMGSCWVV